MKTFEFTEEVTKIICECVTYRIDGLIDENTYIEDMPDEYERNLIEIGKLTTILNYLES